MKLVCALMIVAFATLYKYEVKDADLHEVIGSGFYFLILSLSLTITSRRDDRGGRR